MTKTHDRSRPKPQGAPLAYRLADAPSVSGISASQWRHMIARGEVRAVRHGKMVLIPAAEMNRITGAA